VQVLHTPEKTTIRILSQDIEMPLNQNKSLTPGGKSRGEKTTTDNSESSNVLIWRSLRVYSGRSCRTETTAGANRIRLRKREKERERKKKKRIKQTKEKETKRNKWRRKREEEDLFSLVHQPNPLLGHSLFFCTHYIMSGSLLLLLLFPEKNKNESTPFIIIKYESRALQSRAHTTEFLVVAVVGSGSVVPVWNTRELERERDKRDGS
jgi:hypothetical protein